MMAILEILAILTAMALIVLAAAMWAMMMSMHRIEGLIEEGLISLEMKKACKPPDIRPRPPDGKAETKTTAEYMAPMVRRAKARMERQMRRDGYEG